MEVTKRFLEYKIQALSERIEYKKSIGYKCRADEKRIRSIWGCFTYAKFRDWINRGIGKWRVDKN